MLFKIHSDLKGSEIDDRKFFEMNPGSKAIEQFNKCTSRQMFFVCLVADRDPDSPLRSLPEIKRRTKAAEVAGWPMDSDGKRLDKNGRNLVNGNVQTVEDAIREYRAMQYDEQRDMLDATDTQIQEAIYMMKTPKEDFCKITEKKTNKNTGEVIETTRIDGKLLIQMIKDAMKLGAGLAELKETKEKLVAVLPKTNTVIGDVVTYTSNDMTPDEVVDTEQSTIDIVMAKEREKA